MMPNNFPYTVTHGIKPVWHFTEARQQQTFQEGKPRLYRWCGIQPFTKLGNGGSPDGIRRNNLIVQFRQRKLQERISPTRFEVNAKQLDVRRPFNSAICTPYTCPPTVNAGSDH